MNENKKLTFKTNSKLERLIGRDLITNNTIALFELIKNSYDALASRVIIEFNGFKEYEIDSSKRTKKYYINGLEVSKDYIISDCNSSISIKDNGTGMKYSEVLGYWMEIGTVHKELIKRPQKDDDINRMYSRALNGEKGIGRFGADKLGSLLEMISISDESNEKTTIEVNWDDFDDHTKTIQEVEIDCVLTSKDDTDNSGLILNIAGLRDDWSIKDIEDVKRQLKKFISPFSQEADKFQILFNYANKPEIIINDAFEYSNIRIESKIDKKGVFKYSIIDGDITVSNTSQIDKPSFGEVELNILYMDRAAKAAFTKRTGTSSREYGNIKLFRDNFRILPYGEPNNDWLLIDNKHAQAVFRSLGTRDIVGYVQISGLGNGSLRDATNRQGLVEDVKEFAEFKDFIWGNINILQDYIFNKLKNETAKQGKVIETKVQDLSRSTEVLKNSIYSEIDNLNISQVDKRRIHRIVDKDVKAIEGDIRVVNTANKELEKRMKVFERIMGTEGILYDIIHVIKNKISLVEAQVFRVSSIAEEQNINYDFDIVEKSITGVKKLASAALRKASVNTTKKTVHILEDIVTESIRENELFYSNQEIDTIVEYNDNYQRIYGNKEELKIVIDNLFNNSKRALENINNKKILISTEVDKNYVNILFSDNGCGINSEYAPFIFNVGFSKFSGSGLGLATSYDIMDDHKGDILVSQQPVNGFSTTFVVRIPKR